MKRILFLTAIMFCVGMLSAQDIISLRDGSLIEDVTIISVTNEVITYTKADKKQSIPSSSAQAILYADGRYEEVRYQKTVSSSAPQQAVEDAYNTPNNESDQNTVIQESGLESSKEYNVYAYGVYGGIGYFANSKYDDVTVEYRIIYKSGPENPEFQYLGTTPFA